MNAYNKQGENNFKDYYTFCRYQCETIALFIILFYFLQGSVEINL